MSSANVLPSAPAYGDREETQLYPSLPTNAENFRLTEISKIEKEISAEAEHYRLVLKKYKKVRKVIHYSVVCLGAVTAALSSGAVATSLTGVGIVIGVPVAAVAGISGAASTGLSVINKKLERKVNKHSRILALAVAKHDSINSSVSQALNDNLQAVQNVHKSGKMYQAVINDIDKYLKKSPQLGELLNRLVSSGKMLFLITNSGFEFVRKGMDHMIGKGWRDLFDVIITQARKPSFYHQQASRPFRCLDTRLYRPQWQKVSALCKGQVYMEGNIEQFIKFTGWYGPNVLYLGDHVYSDLRDPVLHHGWRTGAIIPELEWEIKQSNSLDFKRSVVWLTNLQDLIIQLKAFPPSARRAQLTEEWKQERRELRWKLKEMFNPRFGSVFRTYNNSTYFTRRLVRFADLYMSSVENLLNYPSNYTFYPRRTALPHEAVLDFRSSGVPDQRIFPNS
ncbi:hypothetical protein ACROYT_G001482 [Oculina patagonica]